MAVWIVHASNLFDTTDILGRRVTMTWAQWDSHVLRWKPWMHEFVDLVQQAVERPSFISYDTDDAKREIYYAEGLIPDTGELLKVVVDFSDPDLGRTILVYPVTTPKTGEDRRWTQHA